MDAMRFIVLFALVLFGAYSHHEAKKNVLAETRSKDKLVVLASAAGASDSEFMKRAIELSHVAARNKEEHPSGCVITRNGKIVGEGWNTVVFKADPSAHAEVEAIRNASKNIGLTTLESCVIYTSTQPCPMCLSLMYLTGIERIFYCIPSEVIDNSSLSIDHIYGALRLPAIDRPIPEIPMMQSEVKRLLDSYKLVQSDSVL
jgi:guanine deaminase